MTDKIVGFPGGPGPAPSSGGLSFTQGFLLGQLSIVILIGAFIKFFVFGDIPLPSGSSKTRGRSTSFTTSPSTVQHRRSTSFLSSSNTPQKLKTKRSTSHVIHVPPRLTTASILRKTYYNVHSHQPESLDWFNVLIAQTIAQFRDDAQDDDAILTSLTEILNGPQKPDFVADIRVTEIGLGEEFPILSNCRVHPVDVGKQDASGIADGAGGGPRLQAHMDVDISDFITLGVETKLILNYPRPRTAILPIALSVSIVRFSGTLSVSFLPSSSQPSTTANATSAAPGEFATNADTPITPGPEIPGQASSPTLPPSTTPTSLAFSFQPDYRLDISVRSLIGSRSRLQDVPKIAQLVESRLHQWIDERCVEPRMQQIPLPSFWPRKKNMRGPDTAAEGAGGDNVTVGGTPDRRRTSFTQAKREFVENALNKSGRVDNSNDVFHDEQDLGTGGAPFASSRNTPATVGAGGVGTAAGRAASSSATPPRPQQQQQRQQDREAFEEGLRLRRKEYEMPGGMPGMMVN